MEVEDEVDTAAWVESALVHLLFLCIHLCIYARHTIFSYVLLCLLYPDTRVSHLTTKEEKGPSGLCARQIVIYPRPKPKLPPFTHEQSTRVCH